MRSTMMSLAVFAFAATLTAGGGHHGGHGRMNISFEGGDAGDCSALNVRIDGERAAVVAEDVPFHGSALRVRAEEGRGGIRVAGSRGGTYAISVCKAVASGVDPASVRTVLSGNEISVTGPEGDRWAAWFLISAPRGASLDLRASNGPITIADFHGTIDAEAVNGPVTVKNSSGTINAATINGPVTLKGGSGNVKLQATNGPVTVKLDGTTWDGTLEASTQNGPATLKVPSGFRSGALVEALGHGPVSCRGEVCGSQRLDEPFDRHNRPRRIEFGSGPRVVRIATVNGPLSVREGE